MAGTGLTAALVLGALTFKGVDLAKYLIVLIGHTGDKDEEQQARSDAANGLWTLVLGCVVGIGVVLLVAQTGFANDIKIGDKAIGGLDFTSKLALGLAMTSLAGVLYDGKKAVDNSDTASKPKLLRKSEKRRQDFVRDSMRSSPHGADETTVGGAQAPGNHAAGGEGA